MSSSFCAVGGYGVVVCLHAVQQVQLFASMGNVGQIMCCGISGSCQLAATYVELRARLKGFAVFL